MTTEEKIGVLVDRYCRNRSHLAEMLGVTPQTVNNWVYRDHIPRRGIDAIMSRFPQVDLEWLRGSSVSLSHGPLPLPEDEDDDDDDMPYAVSASGISANISAALGITSEQLAIKCGLLIGMLFAAGGAVVYLLLWKDARKRRLLTIEIN